MALRTTQSCGLSVVEVMVSLAVFSVVTVVGYETFLQAKYITDRTHHTQNALWRAHEGITAAIAIAHTEYDDLEEGIWGLSRSSTWELAGTSDTDAGYERTLTVTAIDDESKSVVAEIGWDLKGSAYNTKLEAIVTNWQQPINQTAQFAINGDSAYLSFLSGRRLLTNIFIQNTGSTPLQITHITAAWTKNNRELRNIYSPNGDEIYDGDSESGETIELTTPILLNPGTVQSIQFQFDRNMNNGDFSFNLRAHDGTSVEVEIDDPPTWF